MGNRDKPNCKRSNVPSLCNRSIIKYYNSRRLVHRHRPLEGINGAGYFHLPMAIALAMASRANVSVYVKQRIITEPVPDCTISPFLYIAAIGGKASP